MTQPASGLCWLRVPAIPRPRDANGQHTVVFAPNQREPAPRRHFERRSCPTRTQQQQALLHCTTAQHYPRVSKAGRPQWAAYTTKDQGEGSGYESLASSAAILASRTSRGMVFTPVGSALPASPARRLAQTIFIMRDRAASVALPVWGVITTWGHDRRGWSSGRGSGSKTTVQRSSHTPG